ncbi:MAG: hypothetical protein ACO3QV_08040, partial [Candidatus Nanopelagicaceae bacterium]
IDLDSVSLNLANSSEKEIIFKSSKTMKVDFVIWMGDLVPMIIQNTKKGVGLEKAISSIWGDANASVMMKNKEFMKMLGEAETVK